MRVVDMMRKGGNIGHGCIERCVREKWLCQIDTLFLKILSRDGPG